MAKKKLAKEPDDLIGNALAGETDRGVVLVGTAFIDYWLEGLLRRTFTLGAGNTKDNRDLIENVLVNGPQPLLGSIWARNTAAHLIGLIDDEFDGLINEIKGLRNVFAHKPGNVVLDDAVVDPIVAKLTSQQHLELLKQFQANYESGSQASPWHYLGITEKFSAARLNFMHVCFVIYFYLMGRQQLVSSGDESVEVVQGILTLIEPQVSKSKSAVDGSPDV